MNRYSLWIKCVGALSYTVPSMIAYRANHPLLALSWFSQAISGAMTRIFVQSETIFRIDKAFLYSNILRIVASRPPLSLIFRMIVLLILKYYEMHLEKSKLRKTIIDLIWQ